MVVEVVVVVVVVGMEVWRYHNRMYIRFVVGIKHAVMPAIGARACRGFVPAIPSDSGV